MEPVFTRCGYRCDLCLAYKPNVEKNPANRKTLSDGWYKYFGFRIEPEAILCDGCMADAPRLIDHDCPVRRCTIEKDISNCALCGEYICDRLNERIVDFAQVRHRLGADIPLDDYYRFILPYENKRRLDIYKITRAVIK